MSDLQPHRHGEEVTHLEPIDQLFLLAEVIRFKAEQAMMLDQWDRREKMVESFHLVCEETAKRYGADPREIICEPYHLS